MLTTPMIDQVLEFLNDQYVRLQDEPGVELICQWIEELPKIVIAERERCAKVADSWARSNYSEECSVMAESIASEIRDGQ